MNTATVNMSNILIHPTFIKPDDQVVIKTYANRLARKIYLESIYDNNNILLETENHLLEMALSQVKEIYYSSHIDYKFMINYIRSLARTKLNSIAHDSDISLSTIMKKLEQMSNSSILDIKWNCRK